MGETFTQLIHFKTNHSGTPPRNCFEMLNSYFCCCSVCNIFHWINKVISNIIYKILSYVILTCCCIKARTFILLTNAYYLLLIFGA